MALDETPHVDDTPRWIIITLAGVLLALAAGGTWFYQNQNKQAKNDAVTMLDSIARLKVDQIVRWREERLADAKLFMESPYMNESVSHWLKNPGPAETEKLLVRFGATKKYENYKDVMLADADGRVLLSLSGFKGKVHQESVEAITASLRERNAVITDLHSGPAGLGPHLDVIAPLLSADTEAPIVILMRVAASDFLYPLIQSWPVPSKTAETLLVKKDGDSVIFLNELRHRKGTAFNLRFPLSREDVPAVMAVTGVTGIREGRDYRDVEVFSSIKPIPGSPWFMVAKVDREEALAGWRNRSILIIGFALALLVAAISLAGIARHVGVNIHYKARLKAEEERHASEERYGVTLMSIGDGVIVTDREGAVTMVNTVAEQLTGWKQSEAYGKTVEDVFRIINEGTGNTVENPVKRVFAEGRIVGLANHTLLVSRDGRKIPIMDSGAPIRDRTGKLLGAVLVFRDQSEERDAQNKLQESAQKFQDVFETANVGKSLTLLTGKVVPNKAMCKMLGYTREELEKKTWQEVTPSEDIEPVAREIELLLKGVKDSVRLFKRYIRKDGSIIWGDVSVAVRRDAGGKPLHFITTVVDVTERKLAEEALRDSEKRFKALFDSSQELIVLHELVKDASGGAVDYRILDCNPKFTEVTGIPREKAVGALASELYGIGTVPYLETYAEVAQTGRPARFETFFTGMSKYFRISVFSPEPGRFATVTSDITDRRRAEEELREGEERFRRIFDLSPVGIVLVGPDFKFQRCNDSFCRFLGYSERELQQKTFLDVTHPEDLLIGRVEIKSILEGKLEVTSVQKRYMTGSGKVVWGDVTIRLVKGMAGKPAALLAVIQDVTERKLAEGALRESERRMADIIRFLPDATLAVDRNKRVIIWNKAIEDMTGIPASEMLGKGDYAYTVPFYGYARPQLMDLVFEDSQEVAAKYPHITRAGDMLTAEVFCNALYNNKGAWVLAAVSPLYDVSGKIVGAIERIRDITESRRAEEELRRSEKKFSTVFHSSPIGISITDPSNGRVVDVNEAFLALFGYGREEVVGRSTMELGVWVDVGDREKVFKKLADEGRVFNEEIGFRKKSGEVGTVTVSAEMVDLSGGRFMLAIMQDITERKRLQEQLLQSQKMESIGRLAGGVAHDFNNLLTGIIGNLSLALDETGERDPMRNPLEEIGKAAESAAGLTRQLLAFSRKQIVEPRMVDVNEVLQQSQRMLKRLIGEDIELNFAAGGGSYRVRMDPAQLEQIIINLAVNARDAMPDGGKLMLETAGATLGEEYRKTHHYTMPGDYVMIAVSDTGCGMTGEVKAHLFEPFFTTKEKGKGTGLGLSTVFGAVKQNNGSIEVYSEPGQGTTFKIYLPMVAGAAEQQSKHVSAAMPKGSETLVLVEDEEVVRKFAERVLRKQGYTVHSYTNGVEALAAVERLGCRIDMLVTDVVMPGMDGKTLAENLRRLFPQIKVLFSSGYTENVIAHHGVLDEGIDFIGKPYTPQALAVKVREVLDKG